MPLDAQHGWSRDDHGHRRRDPGAAASRVHPHARRPRRARQRPRRAVPGRRRPGARSASSPRSPGRSAAPATGSGSPPTARSATACSPARSPTCAARCARARATTSSPSGGVGAVAAQAPGHGIDDPTFLQPAARCPRSAADHSAQTPAHPGRGAHATEKRPRGLPSREDRGERLPNGPCSTRTGRGDYSRSGSVGTRAPFVRPSRASRTVCDTSSAARFACRSNSSNVRNTSP